MDFGGGWTDVPPYPTRDGGAVCNVAITRYATASVTSGNDADRHTSASSPASTTDDDALIRAAIRHAGATGVRATLASNFPRAAGLGGSSAAGVALAGAVALLRGESLDPAALAERSRATEVTELGVAGGFQDHYAASFGGALLLEFAEKVRVEHIAMPAELRASLSRRGILVYTGESRISSATITAVRDAYISGERLVVSALARMKALAGEMASALRAADLDALGTLVAEHWEQQRALHPSIATPRIDAIVETAARFGALGTKALGASAGGCVLTIAADGREHELARALSGLGERLAYSIDTDGFHVVADERGDAATMHGASR